MRVVAGFIVVLIGFHYAIMHLHQAYSSYWDFVAFSVVWAGTLAVSIITLPRMSKRVVGKELATSILRRKTSRPVFIKRCCEAISKKEKDIQLVGQESLKSEYQILREGFELTSLGFDKLKVREILEDRIYNNRARVLSIANWIIGLAKYPPAFGLSGTVLGLIHLMRGISDGMSPKETGIRMAIALVATFYGLIIANVLVGPVGESVSQDAKERTELSEIALEAVMLNYDGANLLEAQERLNSYVDPSERVNLIESFAFQVSREEGEVAA